MSFDEFSVRHEPRSSARSLDDQTVESLDDQTVESLDDQTVESLDDQTVESLDDQTVKSLDDQTVKSLDAQAVKSLDDQTVKSLDAQTVKSPDDPTVESPDDPTVELQATAVTSELRYGPLSFVRESWLQPPSSPPPQDADTDPFPVIGPARWINLPSWARRLTTTLAVLAVGVIACLGYLTVHNANAAAKWQQRAAAQVALTQKVSDQLKQANDHITTLDGTVGSLQGQLATAASKEKQNSGVGGALRRLLWPFA